LTGWDNVGPKFVSKFRGFYGLVFVFSRNPENLPWTTTKTDINEESLVYQRIFPLMLTAAKPVLSYLNSLYGSDEVEAEEAREATDQISSRPLQLILSARTSAFSPPKKRKRITTTIQFPVLIADIERIKTHLRRPTMSNRDVGKMAFEYYLENEVSE
jgi:hypothetical protein